MIDLCLIEGFRWDEGSQDKNWRKHQVSMGEWEEIFFNLPILLQDDIVHSQAEPRYFVLGQTNSGRYLFAVFTIRKNKIRVISARDMSQKEREYYEQANP
jgi:uncharacterized protein